MGLHAQVIMICRLCTSEDAEGEVQDVIKALKSKEYVYWGNNRAQDNCDYLFVHSQGSSTVEGILKVR